MCCSVYCSGLLPVCFFAFLLVCIRLMVSFCNRYLSRSFSIPSCQCLCFIHYVSMLCLVVFRLSLLAFFFAFCSLSVCAPLFELLIALLRCFLRFSIFLFYLVSLPCLFLCYVNMCLCTWLLSIY